MWVVELIAVLFFIWLGARLGSIGIGFAGGFGVLVLALVFGLKPGSIPIDVILIIMSVISAIAAMQVAGGLDYMVQVAERILRRNPKYITFLAPVVTYSMTIFAGTGLTAFSTLPVIAEVAKEQGVRPSRPLAIATVASQIAITASPISAAVIFFASELEKLGVSYLQLLMICIPTSFTACMLGAVVTNFLGKDLKDDPIYQERLAQGLVKKAAAVQEREIKPGAKTSVLIFLLGLIFVVGYASAISGNVGLIKDPVLPRDYAIMTIMLTVATLIALACKIKTNDV
ncbi:MAG: anaerobic C4-dicarboxylate transporter family protein, partial [Oceanisphaera sp.]|nr:anaerobic C4-dicarboxylate transporter family protein [Oceanisphaera sp.]